MKDCGDCGLCCKLMGVASLDKPPGKWCGHFRRATGCAVYADRPGDCIAFNCTWLLTVALDAAWKPSVAGFLMHSENEGRRLIVECDPARPHDWRREPYQTTLRGWAASGDVELLVFAGRRGFRLAAHGETAVRRA